MLRLPSSSLVGLFGSGQPFVAVNNKFVNVFARRKVFAANPLVAFSGANVFSHVPIVEASGKSRALRFPVAFQSKSRVTKIRALLALLQIRRSLLNISKR